ncbi:hypothetical protein AB0F43_31980 [Kribbella sp. NPDC023972]|uniref:hypothetical protein n=1 Tax=Kribbella sp. NPDC023972 TaxID=3154795 RepID=UPI0033F1E3E3
MEQLTVVNSLAVEGEDVAKTLLECWLPAAAPRVSGSRAARNHARLAQASLLGLALGARDLAVAAAFVRLTWLDALEVRVESVVDERMEALASGAAVEHLRPWTAGLVPACFHAWQPHLTQLTRSDGSELCLIDIVYTTATFQDLWTP